MGCQAEIILTRRKTAAQLIADVISLWFQAKDQITRNDSLSDKAPCE